MDKYDEDIANILNGRYESNTTYEENVGGLNEVIDYMWNYQSPLFQYLAPRDEQGENLSGTQYYVCLTQVKTDDHTFDFNLEEEIMDDDRIHESLAFLCDDICDAKTYEEVVEIVYPYAEYQRKVDELSKTYRK